MGNMMHHFDETAQRINRANAAAGRIVFFPDHWRDDIEPLTEALDNDDFSRALPFDSDPVARRIAGHMLKEHQKAWDATGRRLVYEGFCPESEATLYVLSYAGTPAYVAALRNIEQLAEVQQDMAGLPFCDTKVSRHCRRKLDGLNAEYPVAFLAIKRGEHVCVFNTCHHCMLHVSSGLGVDHPDYIGPAEDWYDDRQACWQ